MWEIVFGQWFLVKLWCFGVFLVFSEYACCQ